MDFKLQAGCRVGKTCYRSWFHEDEEEEDRQTEERMMAFDTF
jgi:hypothetical protein